MPSGPKKVVKTNRVPPVSDNAVRANAAAQDWNRVVDASIDEANPDALAREACLVHQVDLCHNVGVIRLVDISPLNM